MKTCVFTLLAAVVFLASVAASLGTSFRAKEDNEVIAVDASTGRLLWRYRPWRLSDAHFEMHSAGLVVYPHYASDDKSDPIFLDPGIGELAKPFELQSSDCLARSRTFWSPKEIKLDNGWRLSGFRPGDSKTLQFIDRGGGKPVWEIQTNGYPHEVDCWKDFVFYAFSYLSDEGVLYAYEAGAPTPTWTVDLNQIVKGRKEPLTRMFIQVIGDALYVEANEHIFALNPKTGQLLWHRDLATDLGLQFIPDFYGGGLNLAVFARSQDLLVISFERRVVALDTKMMKYLWHMQPDTFPECPFPIIHDGKVFLSSGDKRRIYQAVPVDHPQPGQSARQFRQLDWHDAPLLVELVFTKTLPAFLDAIMKGDFDRAQQFIDAQAGLSAKKQELTQALYAVVTGHPKCEEFVPQQISVFKYLVKAGADIDAGIETGRTPLMSAIRDSNAQFAFELIKAGAKVNYPKGVEAPIFCVIHRPPLVQALIAAGADVNAQDDEGRTPLHYTCYMQESDKHTYQVIKLLVEGGADLSIRDGSGRNPIQYARDGKSRIIADYMELLGKKAKEKPPR